MSGLVDDHFGWLQSLRRRHHGDGQLDEFFVSVYPSEGATNVLDLLPPNRISLPSLKAP